MDFTKYLQSAKVIAINVVVTFVETFIATLVLTDHPTSQAAILGAGGAAASVVWNTVIKPALKSQDVLYKKSPVSELRG